MVQLVGLALLWCSTVVGVPAHEESSKPPSPRSASTSQSPREYDLPHLQHTLTDFLIPVGLVPGVNLVYWGSGRYLLKEYFAYISAGTVRSNLRHGWVYDDDLFTINQFGHPYQGGSYFNAARSFGLSFWQSAPYVALGSLTWEYFMESGPACCYPSVNDLVTTTIGGIAVGEVLWRLSNSILDNSTSGAERFAREAAALVVNPVYGLYRLSTGETFSTGSALLQQHDIWGEVSFGASLFGSGKAEDFAVIPRYRLRHSRILQMPDDIDAFDYFTLDLALGFSKKGLVGATFDVTGLTNGTKFSLGGTQNALIGLAIDYDFFENVLASLSQSSLGLLLAAEWPLAHELTFFVRWLLAGSFGAISSDYPDIRHYNLGPGATTRIWAELRHGRWGELYVKIDRYWVHTNSGALGDELAGVLDAGATVALFAELGVGFHYLMADKGGYYRRQRDTYEVIHLGEGYLAWRF